MKKFAKFATISLVLVFMLVFMGAAKFEAKTVVKITGGDQVLSVIQGNFGTKVKLNHKVIRWYDFDGRVRIISETKLTHRMLRSRRNRVLYIEKIEGKVINQKLDGRTSCGNYISYRKLRGKVRKGDRITTYCIYNPYTRWIDDIDERYDFIR